jgi:hypothetical protein
VGHQVVVVVWTVAAVRAATTHQHRETSPSLQAVEWHVAGPLLPPPGLVGHPAAGTAAYA